MKRVLYLALALAIILEFTSCYKQEGPSVNENAKKIYLRISTISNLSERRLAFTALSPEEKFDVWEYRFSLMLTGNEV